MTRLNSDEVDWQDFRSYLRLLASTGLNRKLWRKVDPSDVVQQTLLQAHRSWHTYRGESTAELHGWLKQILKRNILHIARDQHRGCRDIDRELSLEQTLSESWQQVEGVLNSEELSPTENFERSETRKRVADLIASLPESQRRAVELHHFLGYPVSEVAVLMQRSVPSVAGLLNRGLKKLRSGLGNSPDE